MQSAASRANQVCRLSKEKWHQHSVPAVGVPRVGGNHKRRKFEARASWQNVTPKPSPLPPGGLSLSQRTAQTFFSPQIDMIGSGAVGGARVARPQPPPSLSITEAHGTQINCQFQSRLMRQICSVLSLPGGETSETNGSASI